MAFAFALILLVIVTVLFHFLSPWWFTPIASNWTTVDDTVNVTFWVTGIVFVAVNLFLAYSVIRYRHRKGSGRRAFYEPENRKLEWWLTGITTVGIAAMLAPGLSVWAKFVDVPDDAAIVEVLGQQWSWSYRFPGKDGALGKADTKLISLENPFGMEPKDAAGADDILVTGEVAAALEGCESPVRGGAIPRKDGHGAGHDHSLLVHANANRSVRCAVRAAVRHGAFRDAWPRHCR
jgi:cytochrome c oxidase subunit 2